MSAANRLVEAVQTQILAAPEYQRVRLINVRGDRSHFEYVLTFTLDLFGRWVSEFAVPMGYGLIAANNTINALTPQVEAHIQNLINQKLPDVTLYAPPYDFATFKTQFEARIECYFGVQVQADVYHNEYPTDIPYYRDNFVTVVVDRQEFLSAPLPTTLNDVWHNNFDTLQTLFECVRTSPIPDNRAGAASIMGTWGVPNEILYPLRAKSPAYKKADTTLKKFLSPSQLSEYNQHQTITVKGAETGQIYKLHRKRQMNIELLAPIVVPSRGKKWACIVPDESVPTPDILLGQLLILQNDESTFLTKAIYW